jgi:type IX secretion system PorP/SprF family membrane protein
LSGEEINGQDELNRYDNVLNPWVSNPAITGSDDNSFNLYANRQWFGIYGAPSFYGFHISGRMAPFDFYTNRMLLNKTSYRSQGKVGLGAALVSDRNGPFGFTELKLNYAYHLVLGKNQLSFGLANDFELHGVRESDMDPLVPGDPRIQGIYRNRVSYNTGIGILFYNRNFDIGGSVNNIFDEGLILKNDYLEVNENGRTFMVHGDYNIPIVRDFIFKPGLMLGTQDFENVLYNVSGAITWKDHYKAILTYRSLQYFILNIGADIERYYIVYGYSSPFGSLSRYIYGSHEITFGIKFGYYVISE